jgi:hypothetical protein
MLEIPDELLRKIVREAVCELGAETDPALLRKVVKEVLRRLAPNKERASFQTDPQPENSSPY